MQPLHGWHESLSVFNPYVQGYITLIEFRETANPSATVSHQPRRLKMNIASKFNNWRKFRQTVNELDRMTDRELHDLGIGRHDIRRVARTAAGI
jgi:uncharacterized protein YjiS (DUF1127 family)